MKFCRHEQAGWSPTARQSELRPQGEGTHGLIGLGAGGGGGAWKHLVKGSPVRPDGQLQIGLWFIISHRAPTPHVPGHGSAHLNLLHARF